MDIGSVDELLTTTRSVRKRLDLTRPVGRDVILECMQLAMQAPTASNTQDWRWLVITDADKRAAIAEIYSSIGAEYLALAAKRHSPTRKPSACTPARSASLTHWPKSPCMSSPAWRAASITPTCWPPHRLGRRSSRPAGVFCLPFGPAVSDQFGRQCIWPRSKRWPNCWEFRPQSHRPHCSQWPTRLAPTSGRPLGRPRRPSLWIPGTAGGES